MVKKNTLLRAELPLLPQEIHCSHSPVYFNGATHTHTHTDRSVCSEAEDGQTDRRRPAVQCTGSPAPPQTGGVWADCPSPLLETGLFACSGADMTCFLVTGTCDNFPTNNKSQWISQRAAGRSSCSLAAALLLCYTPLTPARRERDTHTRTHAHTHTHLARDSLL